MGYLFGCSAVQGSPLSLVFSIIAVCSGVCCRADEVRRCGIQCVVCSDVMEEEFVGETVGRARSEAPTSFTGGQSGFSFAGIRLLLPRNCAVALSFALPQIKGSDPVECLTPMLLVFSVLHKRET